MNSSAFLLPFRSFVFAFVFFSLLSLVSPVTCVAQSSTNKPVSPPPASPDKNLEQTIMQMMREEDEAEIRRDIARLDQMFTDDALLTFADGVTRTKADVINYFKTNPPPKAKPEVKYENVKINTHGDTAVVSCRWVYTTTDPQDEKFGPYQITVVWVKQGGQWKEAAFHVSDVPKPPAGKADGKSQ